MKQTAWQTDKETWEYISIPEENALGYKHESIGLNEHKFDAGKTYLVPPEVATYVRERLKVYARSVVRTLQPNRDTVAENAVSVGTSNAGAKAIDPTTIQ